MPSAPRIGSVARFTAGRSIALGAGVARTVLPRAAQPEALRDRGGALLLRAWQISLDAILSEQLIEQAADRLLTQGVAERIADRVVSGVELDRIVDRSLEQERFEALLFRVVERAVDQLLSSGVVEQIADRLLAGPELSRIVDGALDDGRVEAIAIRVLDHPAVDRLLDRVLYSAELQRVVAHIAESDEVRDALTQQSMGLADEFAGQVRVRTMAADDLLEGFARSVLRRSGRSTRRRGPAA